MDSEEDHRPGTTGTTPKLSNKDVNAHMIVNKDIREYLVKVRKDSISRFVQVAILEASVCQMEQK
jgi:hypothetical protein